MKATTMPVNTLTLIGSAAAIMTAGAVALLNWTDGPKHSQARTPAAITVAAAPGLFSHAEPGEFLMNERPVPAPRKRVAISQPLEIMKYQVSLDEYERCVSLGACEAADAEGSGDVPVTGVSYLDAEAYARWYSEATGETWRLPTDEEWAHAASERFRSDIEPLEQDAQNPARAWLSSYQREVDLERKADPVPRSRGSFGVNSKGVADIAGNVWEWTSTCYARVTMAADGKAAETSIENCGVHVVEGFHRTYMSNFIRDGKSGGCAVGLPPDNLGFRLVRERPAAMTIADFQAQIRRLRREMFGA
ncbi:MULTISPECIES: SUMF1/EgtB/PvdO family nonheme iron enzyme [Aminobacter]|uniref:Formylglycine-generating enzyme required for sulfatase activity n=3 Tax=Aminobacter TaxID=31988 RepID=A0ABR6H572_AMIAI|nr:MULTISPECIES: SUMF1/EgtB/PvdO family nonheme iron enzyme [Aminobacter]MBA8909678.1 formylglycine-generating enzyme required for sulfatase activity [Aminobacter ciceronei]MBA9023468.1 formylglycine-generating enzyme required for sulfatase activity [Aminobacter ciceronei]MBB3705658.1 formylglycine-generating enzyme required for sulfatase activity [Aminobacter aminovorans]MDR7224661.1 formylglycine-generating enzyme required for sulfatase activity [Aminobacter aminovorans]WMC98247.1 SUMF1/EgtB